MLSKICAVLVILGISDSANQRPTFLVDNPLGRARPYNGSDEIEAVFETGLTPEDENSHSFDIAVELPQQSRLKIKFNSEATATLGFLNIEGNKRTTHISLPTPQGNCGRRKVVHTELIVNGHRTKPGDWPWHAALHRWENESIRYICGGTLISKSYVLTAGHCVTINGAPVLPEIMTVIFGKYNLRGGDTAPQEREVHEIIVHEEYYYRRLDNDIALIQLKTEAVYNDYVQPACLWHGNDYENLPPGVVYGTVVGWGLNHKKRPSSQLDQITLPKISDSTCIKTNPDFFGRMLNSRKFCAGYRNGTSVCNGDSGGGFVVFVPDEAGDTSANAPGSWHVQGIVSSALSRPNEPKCDPTQYSLFTNVASFVGWIEDHLKIL